MRLLRRAGIIGLLLLGLAACGDLKTQDALVDEVVGIADAVRDETGTPEEIADAVRATPRGPYMTLEVLFADYTVSEDGGDRIKRLEFELHFAGYPDGFGDVPAKTCRYRLEFDDGGLVGKPDQVGCSRYSGPDQ